MHQVFSKAVQGSSCGAPLVDDQGRSALVSRTQYCTAVWSFCLFLPALGRRGGLCLHVKNRSSRPRRAYLRPWTPCVQPILCAWPRGQTHRLLGSLSAQAGEATSRVAHPIGRTAATLTSLAKGWSQPIPAPLPPRPPSVPPPPFPPPTRLYGVAHDPPGPALLAAGAHSVPRRRPARPPRGRPHVHAPGGGYCGVVPAVAGALHQPHQPVPPARADDAVKVAVMLQLGRLVRGPDR